MPETPFVGTSAPNGRTARSKSNGKCPRRAGPGDDRLERVGETRPRGRDRRRPDAVLSESRTAEPHALGRGNLEERAVLEAPGEPDVAEARGGEPGTERGHQLGPARIGETHAVLAAAPEQDAPDDVRRGEGDGSAGRPRRVVAPVDEHWNVVRRVRGVACGVVFDAGGGAEGLEEREAALLEKPHPPPLGHALAHLLERDRPARFAARHENEVEAELGPHRIARLADGLRERGPLELGNHPPAPEPSERAAAPARRTFGRLARDRGEVLPGENAVAQGDDPRAGRGLLLGGRRLRARHEDVRGLDPLLHAPARRILRELAGPVGAKLVLRRLGQAVGDQRLGRGRAARLRLAGEQEVVRELLRGPRPRAAAGNEGVRVEDQPIHVAERGGDFAVDRHRRLGEARFVDVRRRRPDGVGTRRHGGEGEEGEEEGEAFHRVERVEECRPRGRGYTARKEAMRGSSSERSTRRRSVPAGSGGRSR